MRLRSLPGALLLAGMLHGTVHAQPPDTLPPDPTRDAYLDDTARHLMRGVRAARDTARLAIDSYTALIQERIGIQLPTVQRDRPLAHGERVARLRWSRQEPNVVRVLGARVRRAGAGTDDVPDFFPGLETERLAADPFWDPFLGPSADALEAAVAPPVRSPLAPGSESHYQFRSGDTVSVQLQSGRAVDAVTVTVIPRYPSIRLVAATLWIDPESLGLVRVASRPAKRADREISGRLKRDGEWRPEIWLEATDTTLPARPPANSPGLFERLVNLVANRMVKRLEVDVAAVVVDYDRSEAGQWLPRSIRIEGYVGWENVTATGYVPPTVPVTFDWAVDVESVRERSAPAEPAAPQTAVQTLARWQQPGDSVGGDVDSGDPDETVIITPADRQALAASDLLPPSIWQPVTQESDPDGFSKIADDLAAIGTGTGGAEGLATSPWFFFPPFMALGLMRYNPIEGVSTAAYLRRDFGWWRSALTVRTGTREWATPEMDLTLQRDHPGRRLQFSIYRALRSGGLGIGGINGWPGYFVPDSDSLSFHWSRGASIRLLSGNGKRNRLSMSLFAERDAEIETDAERDRFGATLEWRPWWDRFEAGSAAGGGYLGMRGSAGDNPHFKAIVTGAVEVPLASNLSMGVQLGVAGVWGDPAPQDFMNLGGTAGWLRGHSPALRSTWIRMARLDFQRQFGPVSFSVFGDWAAAESTDFQAVGAGLVFLDGMLRLDIARGLGSGMSGGPQATWRFSPRMDAFF